MHISDWSSDVCSSDLCPGTAMTMKAVIRTAAACIAARMGTTTRTMITTMTTTTSMRKCRSSNCAASGSTSAANMRRARKSGVKGTRVLVRVDRGGCRSIKKKKEMKNTDIYET